MLTEKRTNDHVYTLMPIRFYLLGRFRVELAPSGGLAVALPKLRKARGLLAYLLLARGRACSRDELAALFWGDVAEERARDSLTTALGAIRAIVPALGLELKADRYHVQLDLGSAWLDVDELEKGLSSRASKEERVAALELYQDELLADWQDEWVIYEREQLRRRMLPAGTKLLREHLAAHEWEAGILLVERMLEQDPLDTTFHEMMMTFLLGTGQREAARRHFQQYEALLQTQLGIEPSAEARIIYNLVAGPNTTPAAAADKTGQRPPPAAQELLPFGDRVKEQALLHNALAELRQGHGGLILISGESGIGKTSLVEHILTQARGLHIARGRAFEFERDAAFSLLLRSLNSWLLNDLAPAQVASRLGHATAATLMQVIPELAAILPGLKALPPLPPEEAQTQLVQAFVAALLAPARAPGAPAILFLDDLHFADSQSLSALAQLHERLVASPLLVIATYRADEIHEGSALDRQLDDLAQNGALTINLSPLGLADVQAMVEPREPNPVLSHWLHKRSHGNPFFLIELLRGLAEAGKIAPDMALGGWYISAALPEDQPALTEGAQAAIMQRFHRLSPHAQTVVQIAAVIAGEADLGTLLTVGSLDEAEGVVALDEAVARRFLAMPGDNRYRIEHDLIRSAIYQSLSGTRRPFLHGRIAAIMEDSADEPFDNVLVNDITFHYGLSANRDKQREFLARAADLATRTYAYEAAIDNFRKLLPLLARKQYAGQRLEAYRRMAEALRGRGRFEEAAEIYSKLILDAEAVDDLLAQAQAWNGLSIVQSYLGQAVDSLQSAVQAAVVARAGGEAAKSELAQALIRQGWVLYHSGENKTAQTKADEALLLAYAIDDQIMIASALNLLGATAQQDGRVNDAFNLFERALQISRALNDNWRVVSLLNNLGDNRYWQGEYDAAARFFNEAIVIAKRLGSREAEIMALSGLGITLSARSEYDGAEAELRRAISISRDARSQYSLPHTYLALGRALLGQARLIEALDAIGEAYRLATDAEAHSAIAIAWRLLGMTLAQIEAPISFAGRECDAAAAFDESLQITIAKGMPRQQARTLREWALYEARHGNRERALVLIGEALDIFRQLDMTQEAESTAKLRQGL